MNFKKLLKWKKNSIGKLYHKIQDWEKTLEKID